MKYKYKIEIWIYGSIVKIFEANKIKQILEWYKENWQVAYEFGNCTFYVYDNR